MRAAARAEADGTYVIDDPASIAWLPEADRAVKIAPSPTRSRNSHPVARVLADPHAARGDAPRRGRRCRNLSDDAKKESGQIPYGSSCPYGTSICDGNVRGSRHQTICCAFRGAGPALTHLLTRHGQALAARAGYAGSSRVDDGQDAGARELGRRSGSRVSRTCDVSGSRLQGCRIRHLAGCLRRTRCQRRFRIGFGAMGSGESAGGVKTFETAGARVRLHGRAGISKFARKTLRG